MQVETVVVVAGGEAPRPESTLDIPPGARVIVADRGLDHAHALGLDVATAVGDFDSASPEAVAAAEAGGTRIVRHREDKDATDLELALDAASELDPRRILVLGDGGGRLDHVVSALLLLASARFAGTEIDARVGAAQVHVVRGERVLTGVPGELVTLLPVGGAAEGVRTEGLAFPLDGETLEPGTTRGVSNRFLDETAHVSVERGVLLAIRPGDAA